MFVTDKEEDSKLNMTFQAVQPQPSMEEVRTLGDFSGKTRKGIIP